MAIILLLQIISCKKSSVENLNVKNNFTGNWAGTEEFLGGIPVVNKFSLAINTDNSVVNIDSSSGNRVSLGTYTYTADSLKINYNNGTTWSLKFLNNYSECSGTATINSLVGATIISMQKKQ